MTDKNATIVVMSETNQSTAFRYTEDQQAAIDYVRDWWKNGRSKSITLGGYAGTGKTTIIAHLPDELGLKPDYLAPTGKAAQVLRRKGIDAVTIHSYIYDFRGKTTNEDVRTGDTRDVLHFEAKDNRVGESPLVVVDESSMISGPVYDDLMASLGTARVLFVGDHGQLEPVGKNPGLMKRPDVRLETIMRQADGNPILSFAHRVREKASLRDNLDLVDGDRFRIVGQCDSSRLAKAAIDQNVDQIIVPFHRVRNRVNAATRKILGLPGVLADGDRVVARLNNRGQGIYNGNQFKVVGEPREDNTHLSDQEDRKFIADLRCVDTGREWSQMSLFMPGPSGQWSDGCHKETNVAIDYAYAITCHVAQGSEWSSVLVYYAPCRAWSNERWLYTAATRAAQKLIVVAGG